MGGRVEEDRLEERGRPVEGGDQHGSSNLGVNRTEPRIGGRSQREGIEKWGGA